MLEETGDAPRVGPLRSGYMVHFGPLNLALRFIDRGLGLIGRGRGNKTPSMPVHPRSILISQPGHLGDVVNALTVVEPLRKAFPDCRIGFLVSSWSAAVLRGHAAIDHVHIFDNFLLNREPRWRQKLRRHRATRSIALREIRNVGYDAAVELSFNFPNNIPLLRRALIARRGGWTSGGFGPLLTHPLTWRHRADWHVTQYHRTLLEHFFERRFDSDLFDLRRTALPVSQAEADAVPQASYAVIHMGSGGPSKAWPLKQWAALVARLHDLGHVLVFTGAGAQEQADIRALTADRTDSIDLGGQLTWQQFTRVVGQARFTIGVDSAVGHVAAAQAVPSVTIYHGMTDQALYRPLSAVNLTVTQPVHCAPCYRSRGCPSMDCIRTVPPSAVLDTLTRLLR